MTPSQKKVYAVLGGDPATTAQIAKLAGVEYSTADNALRALHLAGHVHRIGAGRNAPHGQKALKWRRAS